MPLRGDGVLWGRVWLCGARLKGVLASFLSAAPWFPNFSLSRGHACPPLKRGAGKFVVRAAKTRASKLSLSSRPDTVSPGLNTLFGASLHLTLQQSHAILSADCAEASHKTKVCSHGSGPRVVATVHARRLIEHGREPGRPPAGSATRLPTRGRSSDSVRPRLLPANAGHATRGLRDETRHSQNSTARTPHPAQVVQGWCAD